MIHSVILFWMPMFSYQGDVIWSNGREGGYLVLGNMVYTVRSDRRHQHRFNNVFLIVLVRRGHRLP